MRLTWLPGFSGINFLLLVDGLIWQDSMNLLEIRPTNNKEIPESPGSGYTLDPRLFCQRWELSSSSMRTHRWQEKWTWIKVSPTMPLKIMNVKFCTYIFILVQKYFHIHIFNCGWRRLRNFILSFLDIRFYSSYFYSWT